MRQIRADGDGGDPLPPIELYKLAVEEYRFQAEFNWKRTQYLLAFNAAILAAGLAVAGRFEGVAWPVFALGMVAALLASLVVRQQHTYYRATRKRLKRIEDLYQIPEPVDTTATQGGRSRLYAVTTLIHVLLGAIAVADLVSLVYFAVA